MSLDKLFEKTVKVQASGCRAVWYQAATPEASAEYDFDIGRGGPLGLGQPESIFRYRMRRLVDVLESQVTGLSPCKLHCDDPGCEALVCKAERLNYLRLLGQG